MNRRDFILSFGILGGTTLLGGVGTFWQLMRAAAGDPEQSVNVVANVPATRPQVRPSAAFIPTTNTAVVYHPDYLRYAGPPVGSVWERPQRLEALVTALQRDPKLSRLPVYQPFPASQQQISEIHASWYTHYIERWAYLTPEVRALLGHPVRPAIKGDVMANSVPLHPAARGLRQASRTHPYYAAALSAGGGIAAAELVMRGYADNAFALIRPPGHHARYGRYGGFCIFNNAAIAAKYLQHFYGVRRVLILDWDAHHGNGTQEAFYSDPSVLYISLHQIGIYPRTGQVYETGAGAGRGYNVNVPLPAGTGDRGYLRVFESVLDPIVRAFEPEFVIVSAGQDSHHKERIAQLKLTTGGYMAMTRYAMEWARDFAQGRLVALLEGGYQIDGIVPATKAIIGTLAGAPPEPEPPYPELLSRYYHAQYERVARTQRQFWPKVGPLVAAR